jgi:hypothetical protein
VIDAFFTGLARVQASNYTIISRLIAGRQLLQHVARAGFAAAVFHALFKNFAL